MNLTSCETPAVICDTLWEPAGREILRRGFTGVIFGKKQRRAEGREYLAWLFTRLLPSQERGSYTAGAAWVDAGSGHRLSKRPMTTERFVADRTFGERPASMANRVTLLLGHTRWHTRGDE